MPGAFDLQSVREDERPARRDVLITSAFFLVPFTVLLGGNVLAQFTPQYAAALAICRRRCGAVFQRAAEFGARHRQPIGTRMIERGAAGLDDRRDHHLRVDHHRRAVDHGSRDQDHLAHSVRIGRAAVARPAADGAGLSSAGHGGADHRRLCDLCVGGGACVDPTGASSRCRRIFSSSGSRCCPPSRRRSAARCLSRRG